MKKVFAFLITTYCAFLIVACGSNNGGDNNNNVVNNCFPPNYVNNGVCTSGVIPNGPGTPGVPSYVQFYDYNRAYNSYGQMYNGDMQIVNTGAFKTFLKEALAVCDRNIWGWQSGLASCDSWVSGSFKVAFSVDASNKPIVRFEAYPAPNWYSYTLSFGIDAGGAAFNPLVLNSNNTFSLINQSKGFEIRAQGSSWNASGLRLIQIQVLNGTLKDGYFTYDIYYPYNGVATKFASGKFKKY